MLISPCSLRVLGSPFASHSPATAASIERVREHTVLAQTSSQELETMPSPKAIQRVQRDVSLLARAAKEMCSVINGR